MTSSTLNHRCAAGSVSESVGHSRKAILDSHYQAFDLATCRSHRVILQVFGAVLPPLKSKRCAAPHGLAPAFEQRRGRRCLLTTLKGDRPLAVDGILPKNSCALGNFS